MVRLWRSTPSAVSGDIAGRVRPIAEGGWVSTLPGAPAPRTSAHGYASAWTMVSAIHPSESGPELMLARFEKIKASVSR
jgi:hypothetical protein